MLVFFGSFFYFPKPIFPAIGNANNVHSCVSVPENQEEKVIIKRHLSGFPHSHPMSFFLCWGGAGGWAQG